ncbi:UDP-forming cellulose synthase catalytic subunit [Rhizobium sp. 2YAF20]|uniref:UDP-forming cellulose synthase catalytic subunit n=1 Tax=Rhizobium sp. 2YAF20 TaxID=3233027 RepID=UPI003F95A618
MSKNFSFVIWSLSSILAVFLITQPLGNSVQIVLSVFVIGILAMISILRLDGIWRHILLALGTVVVLRYAYWRTTSTLPPIDDLYSFIPGILLYAVEMYCIAMLAANLFVVSDPYERPPAPRLKDEDCPTIDVFVPSYNESSDILALTLSSAKAMHYPKDKLNIVLLDDGGTDQKRNSPNPEVSEAAHKRAAELKDLCADLGVTYLTRAENVHAKAGNLNNGLMRTDGELVVVFDADHAPERNFLQETIGYFSENEKLFLVQTPHFFSNPDPIEHNLGTFTDMPSENEMFYGKIQKGLDRWNAAFFCGSAAVLRREALDEVGGFSGVTITEDCETALELHSRGWHSAYVDKPLISGLQPETFSSFIGQRSRWCQGMIQILLLKNPLFKAGLTLPQRICYLSTAMFWFFPVYCAVFFCAPLLFILFNMKFFVASSGDFLAYSVTYLVVTELIRNHLYGKVRWPWVSELYSYTQSVYLFRAVCSVIAHPRRPTFNVTAKGMSTRGDRLSELSLPYFLIYAVLGIALFVAAYRYSTEPEISGQLLIVGGWNCLNLIIAGAALGVVTERRNDVAGIQLPSSASVQLSFGDTVVSGTVIEASSAGAKVVLARNAGAALRKGDYGRLSLVSPSSNLIVSSMPITISAQATGENTPIVLKFDPEAHHYPIISELMFRDLEQVRTLRAKRQKRVSMIGSSLTFIKWAITCPVAALGLAITGGSSDADVKQQKFNQPANSNEVPVPVSVNAKGGVL